MNEHYLKIQILLSLGFVRSVDDENETITWEHPALKTIFREYKNAALPFTNIVELIAYAEREQYASGAYAMRRSIVKLAEQTTMPTLETL